MAKGAGGGGRGGGAISMGRVGRMTGWGLLQRATGEDRFQNPLAFKTGVRHSVDVSVPRHEGGSEVVSGQVWRTSGVGRNSGKSYTHVRLGPMHFRGPSDGRIEDYENVS